MKDIIDSLKLRLNSPFIISFIIAWPFWNWEIMVALLWYDSNKIKIDTEWQTYFQLINHYASFWRSLFAPILSAIIYTIGYPLLKWGISAFNAWVGSKEEDAVLKLTDSGSVPTTRFVKEMRKSKEKIKELSEIIQEESVVLSKNQELELDIAKKSSQIVQVSTELEVYKERAQHEVAVSDIKYLDGSWSITIQMKEIIYTDSLVVTNQKFTISTQRRDYFQFERIRGYFPSIPLHKAFLNISISLSDRYLKETSGYEEILISEMGNFFGSNQLYEADFENMSFIHSSRDFKVIFLKQNVE